MIFTARDKGPNPDDGQNYQPTAVQTILVQDTQPPILLAPPSKVIEAASTTALADAKIGTAVAVDLADVQPTVINSGALDGNRSLRECVAVIADDHGKVTRHQHGADGE